MLVDAVRGSLFLSFFLAAKGGGLEHVPKVSEATTRPSN